MSLPFVSGWRRVVVFCLLLVSPVVGGKERVPGVGFANPNPPAVTNDPPDDYTDPDGAHDPKKGTHYLGPDFYDLRDGGNQQDKHRWRTTNYVAWHVNGATLRANGQATDGDSKNATLVTSEAWGAELVVARVESSEGAYGWIGAVNAIGFEYAYTISGNHIGEASVQLQGTADDIMGKEHKFNLSDQRAEGVGSEESTKSGFEQKDYANLKASYGSTSKGMHAGVSGELGSEAKEHSALDAKVSRRYAKAGGDSDSTPGITVRDEVSGSTPLEWDYAVFSTGSVALRARAGKVAGQDTESEVVVYLKKFKIQNSLQVFKEASASDDFDGFDPPGPRRGPTTPGENEPPPPPPGELPPGPTTPGEDPIPPPHAPTDGGPPDPAGSGNTAVDPTAGGNLELQAPHGLDGEGGARPGVLRLVLAQAAPRDLVFELSAEPAGRIDLLADGRVRIPQGDRHGFAFFGGLSSGPATIVLSLLDGAGQATGSTLTADCAVTSVDEHEQPVIWVGSPWRAGQNRVVRGFRNGRAGPLLVGRLGFAGFDDTATVLQVEVDDPMGVLVSPPSTVVIPAGQESVELTLPLTPNAGRARLVLRSGAQSVRVSVVSRAQSWKSVPVVRVPLGAVAPIPILLGWPERTTRMVSGSVADTTVGRIAESDTQTQLLAGETGWHFRFRGDRIGHTTVTLVSPGLPALPVLVQVVPATVSIQAGMLRLNGLPPAAHGSIEFWVPDGVTIAALDLPLGAGSTLALTGVGTGKVVLTFVADPDMPTILALPIRFGGDTGAGVEVGVFDHVREFDDGYEGVRNSYHIEVR